MRVSLVTGLIVFLLVAACSSRPATRGVDSSVAGRGGGVDALPPSDANPSTVQGFCVGYLERVADYFSRCDGFALDYARSLFVTDSPCQRLQGNIAAGRLAFDGTHGAACLQALSAALAACDGSTSMQDTGGCEQVLMPLVPVGGTCTSVYDVDIGEQCKDFAYCKKGASHACTGVCATRTSIGGACDPNTDTRCVLTGACDSKSKLCVAASKDLAAGDPCGAEGPPSCARTLYCDRTGADAGAASGVCRTKKTSGACAGDLECATFFRCVGTTAMTCAAIKKEGEACTPNAHQCDYASHCAANGKCTSARTAVGEPCDTITGEPTLCADGAYCDRSSPSSPSGVCRANKHDGDACQGPSLLECGGDNGHCDTTTHSCLSCAP